MRNKDRTKKVTKMPQEDILMYRIVILLIVGIFGMAILRSFSSGIDQDISKVLFWLSIPLFAFAILLPWFFGAEKSKSSNESIISVGGISISIGLLAFMMFTYRLVQSAIIKFQVLFLVVIFLAFLYNIHSRGFFKISLVLFSEIVSMYYTAGEFSFPFEKILHIILPSISVLLPIACITVEICGNLLADDGKIKIGKITLSTLEKGFYSISMVAVSLIMLVCAALILILPYIMSLLVAAILVLYIIFGIVCTVRLM